MAWIVDTIGISYDCFNALAAFATSQSCACITSNFPSWLQGYNDAKLVVAGRGGMIDELRAQVNYLGISNKVYFTGYLDHKSICKMYNFDM